MSRSLEVVKAHTETDDRITTKSGAGEKEGEYKVSTHNRGTRIRLGFQVGFGRIGVL